LNLASFIDLAIVKLRSRKNKVIENKVISMIVLYNKIVVIFRKFID